MLLLLLLLSLGSSSPNLWSPPGLFRGLGEKESWDLGTTPQCPLESRLALMSFPLYGNTGFRANEPLVPSGGLKPGSSTLQLSPSLCGVTDTEAEILLPGPVAPSGA